MTLTLNEPPPCELHACARYFAADPARWPDVSVWIPARVADASAPVLRDTGRADVIADYLAAHLGWTAARTSGYLIGPADGDEAGLALVVIPVLRATLPRRLGGRR
jgi:hypothetical protein